MPSPSRVVLSFALFTLLLTLGSTPSAAQYDGALSLNWGAGDGFATWQGPGGSGQVFLETAVATNDLLYGVGDYDFPAGTRSLHFQAVDRNGEERTDRACHDSTADFGAFTDESGGEAAIIDSSGNLLIGGWLTFQGTSRLHALVARYEIDQPGCTLDEDFSTDGFRLFDTQGYCDTEACVIVALGEIRPETGAVSAPRTIALLRAAIGLSSYDYYLLGLTTSGSVDTAFGSGTSGVRQVAFAGLGTLRSNVAMTVDDLGRIVVLVTRVDPGSASDLDTMALRYTANGAIDASFGANGLMTIQDSGDDDPTDTFAGDLLMLPDGSGAASVQRGSDWLLCRFDDEGVFSAGASTPETVAQFAYQGDDRFLTARESLSVDELRIRRFDLIPEGYYSDPSFGSETGGGETYDIDLGGGTGQSIVDFLLWGGRPVLVGHAFDSGGDASGFLMRTENAYIFADGFEGGNRARWWGY